MGKQDRASVPAQPRYVKLASGRVEVMARLRSFSEPREFLSVSDQMKNISGEVNQHHCADDRIDEAGAAESWATG
jgi:hypothetical protein